MFGVSQAAAWGSVAAEGNPRGVTGLVIGTGNRVAAAGPISFSGASHLAEQGAQVAEPYASLGIPAREGSQACCRWPPPQGSLLSLVYDAADGSVEFLRDGASLGVAFKGIQPPVRVALVMASNCSFTLC